MQWYGSLAKFQCNKSFRSYKKKLNLKIKILSFSLIKQAKLRTYQLFVYLPSLWNIIILRRKVGCNNGVLSYFFSSQYFFWLNFHLNFTSILFDRNANSLELNFRYKNNFYSLYWKTFKGIIYSFSKVFFKKLRFRGKGFYIYKNFRNTVAMQFGYSHRVRVHLYKLSLKFITKTSVFLYGINKQNLSAASFNLKNVRSINIFTGKGIRFTRQIIYKKTGKVGSYR